jgi:CHASE1-domain containing sensor protein
LWRAGRVFEHLRRMSVAYAVLLVALALTLLAYYYVRQNVEASVRDQLDETVRAAQDAIDRQMDSYVEAMLGSRGLFYASSSVEEGEWDDYSDGIDIEERLRRARRDLGEGRFRGPDRGSSPRRRTR